MSAHKHSDGPRGDERELTDEEAGILSPEEAYAIFDAEVRRVLGMSAEEFLRKWDAGEIVDDDTNWDLTELILMFPFAGRAYPG